MRNPPGASTSTAARLHIARANAAMIGVALGRAAETGAEPDDVVAILLDTRDRIARDLAAAILEKSDGLDLEAEEARVLKRDEIPTAISILPAGLVEALFRDSHPQVSASLRRTPPSGSLRVVVVADGGATLMHLPVAPVRSTGSA